MTLERPIRLGTRRSRLAMAQSGMVARDLERVSGRPVELVEIVSEGDTSRASLASLGGAGVFATRLREALAAGECDLLVHSLKDLPVEQPPGFALAATPRRADARDVVITRDGTSLDDLAPGARVGTGSPRRIAQVHRANPGAVTQDLRGNIDSRMDRVRSGELDAIVLAAAGLGRVDADGRSSALGELHAEPRGLERWPSAAGQAALAVETLEAVDPQVRQWISEIDDPVTRFAITVERTILAGIEAGCHAPVGVHADIAGEHVRVRASVYDDPAGTAVSVDHSERVDGFAELADGYIRGRGSTAAADASGFITRAREIGDGLARRLLDEGAADIVTREAASTS